MFILWSIFNLLIFNNQDNQWAALLFLLHSIILPISQTKDFKVELFNKVFNLILNSVRKAQIYLVFIIILLGLYTDYQTIGIVFNN